MKVILYLSVFMLFFSCGKDEPPKPPTNDVYTIYFDDYENLNYGEVFKIQSDGSGEVKLTNLSKGGSLSILSSQPFHYNDKIYFVSNNTGPNARFNWMNLDGTTIASIPNFITSANAFDLINPFVYQNGSKMVYCKSENALNSGDEIYSSNIDGTNPVRLTSFLVDKDCFDPSVNAANDKIVFVKDGQIYTMNVDGTSKTRITNSTSLQFESPRFSPDGTKIIADGLQVLNNKRSSEIYRMNSDGTNLTKLTNYAADGTIDNASSITPIFSKDGVQIIYVSNQGATDYTQLFIMDADGANKKKITTTPFHKTNPNL